MKCDTNSEEYIDLNTDNSDEKLSNTVLEKLYISTVISKADVVISVSYEFRDDSIATK